MRLCFLTTQRRTIHRQLEANLFIHKKFDSQGLFSIIAVFTSWGSLYYSTLTENNNSHNFTDHIKNLMRCLIEDLKFWRKQIILLIDKSPIHTSKIWKEFFNSLRIITLFLHPYSLEYALVELLINVIKQRFVINERETLSN